MRSLVRTLALCTALTGLVAPLQAQTNQGGGTTAGGGGGTQGGQGGQGGQATTGNFGPTGGLNLGGGLGTTVQGTGATGNAAGIPTTPNPFRGYYANPLGIGMSGATTTTLSPKAAFGQPLFGPIAANAALATIQQAAASGGFGFATVGLNKAPSYVTTLSDDIPLIRHLPAQLERDLQDVLRRSSTLTSKDRIAVSVSGQVAILRGQVSSERELRLAESLIRLTPGVRDVQNELTVNP